MPTFGNPTKARRPCVGAKKVVADHEIGEKKSGNVHSLYWELVVHQDRKVLTFGNVVHVLLHLTHSPALAENR